MNDYNKERIHFNFLDMMQFNILIKLNENPDYSIENDSDRKMYDELCLKLKEIQDTLFPKVQTYALMRENHQININIAGLFNPKEKEDEKGFKTKKWFKMEHDFYESNDYKEGIYFEDHYCEQVLREFLKDIKYSVQKAQMIPNNFYNTLEGK